MASQANKKQKSPRYFCKTDGALLHKSYADRAIPRTLLTDEQIQKLYKGQRYDRQHYQR